MRLNNLVFGKKEQGEENPIVKLKLFLIVSFLTLHILNLCTTLTEQTALTRHTVHTVPSYAVNFNNSQRTDPNSPTLAPVLQALVDNHPSETDLVVQIIPSNQCDMSSPVAPSIVKSTVWPPHTPQRSKMASIDHFMSEWSTLVGDPVLSKWIVVALGISVLLNGYLLKGIASRSVPDGSRGPVAAAAARLVGAWDTSDLEKKKRRRWSGGSHLELHRPDRSREPTMDGSKSSTPKGKSPVKSQIAIPPTVPRPAPEDEGEHTPKGLHIKELSKEDGLGHIIIPGPPAVPIKSPAIPTIMTTSSSSSSLVSMTGEHHATFGRRSLEECVDIFAGGVGARALSDEEVIMLVENGKIAPYALEKVLKNLERAVRIRRAVICELFGSL